MKKHGLPPSDPTEDLPYYRGMKEREAPILFAISQINYLKRIIRCPEVASSPQHF
jgi:hypothetical protein